MRWGAGGAGCARPAPPERPHVLLNQSFRCDYADSGLKDSAGRDDPYGYIDSSPYFFVADFIGTNPISYILVVDFVGTNLISYIFLDDFVGTNLFLYILVAHVVCASFSFYAFRASGDNCVSGGL